MTTGYANDRQFDARETTDANGNVDINEWFQLLLVYYFIIISDVFVVSGGQHQCPISAQAANAYSIQVCSSSLNSAIKLS
jgi:hypothetical protein